MSADLDDRIRQATSAPVHGLDVQQVRARARQLRRRRAGGVAAAGAGLAVLGFVAVPALTSRSPVPTIAPDPAASAPGQAPSPEPQTDSSERATDDQDLTSWRRVRTGGSLTLSTDAWAQPSFEPLAPDRAGNWSPAADDVVAALTQPNPNGDGPPNVMASPHVGPDGRLLVIPSSDTDRVLVVAEDGTQHVVTLPMTGRTTATWAPAGYWFLLTRSDETVTVHRIGDDGRVRSSEPVPPEYLPEWGARLHVQDDEIWVSAGFDADPTRGPQAVKLAEGGGDTIVDAVEWVPIDQSPVMAPGDLAASGASSFSVPVEGGAVAVTLQHHDGVDVDLTVLALADDPPVVHRERIATTAAGDVPDVHATVVLSDGDAAWATGFPDIAAPTGVGIDPLGTPWFVRITPEGYALTELVPPAPTVDE